MPELHGPAALRGRKRQGRVRFLRVVVHACRGGGGVCAKQQSADEAAQEAAARAEAGEQSAFDHMADETAGASSVVTDEVIDAAVAVGTQADDPIASFLSRASWNDEEREGMRSYVCSSCGAQLTADATTAIKECPYCGNQAMRPARSSLARSPMWSSRSSWTKRPLNRRLPTTTKARSSSRRNSPPPIVSRMCRACTCRFGCTTARHRARARSRRATSARGARASTR